MWWRVERWCGEADVAKWMLDYLRHPVGQNEG